RAGRAAAGARDQPGRLLLPGADRAVPGAQRDDRPRPAGGLVPPGRLGGAGEDRRALPHRGAGAAASADRGPGGHTRGGGGAPPPAVLAATMRREGDERTVARPTVVTRQIDGALHEPVERLTVDVPEDYLGAVTALLAVRKGRMENMTNHGTGWVRLDYTV